MIPGEIVAAAGAIELNAGTRTVTVEVTNTGERPFVFNNLKAGQGLDAIVRFIETERLLAGADAWTDMKS
jgi:Ni2+-binding GTPase involved in maturation of urease and hydrogenase